MNHEQDELHEQGQIDATEIVNGGSCEDLHFRYIGTAKGRQFVVNVQFDLRHSETGEGMQPIERSFMVARILGMVLERVTEKPDSGLN